MASSGTPFKSAGSSTKCAKSFVVSIKFSSNLVVSFERDSCIALKRILSDSANSAPPKRKSRTSFSTIFFCAAVSLENPALFFSARNFAYKRSSCERSE